MKLFTAAATIGCLAILGAVLAPTAHADEWNRKTIVKFSGPFEIPGVHLAGFGNLPAGTYVFKVMDSQSNRHVVQIFSEDEKTVYATILAIPNFRLKATDKTVITFRERPAGQPEALRAWFYPGRHWGEEFVYPKAKAIELAKSTNLAVLFTPAELPAEVSEPTRLGESAISELKRAPIMAVKPSGEEVAVAEVVTPPPDEELQVAAAPAPAPAATPAETLPATASPLPLIGLIGLVTLGGGMMVRALASRVR